MQLSKVVESDSYALEGINAESVITISNGEYAINDNDYTSNSDVVFPGDSIKIRTVAPDIYKTTKTVTVNIGRSSQDFHVVTQDKVEGVLAVDDSKAIVALWFLLCLGLCVPLIRGWSCRYR